MLDSKTIINEKDELISLLQQELEHIKNVEKARMGIDERYKILFESSNDAIMLLNDEGFFDCNPKTLEMFGLKSIDEFIKVHPAQLSPLVQPDGTDSYVSANEKINFALLNNSHHFNWIHKRTNGETFPAEVLLSKFIYDGHWLLQATVRDVTTKMKNEQLLIESENHLRTLIQTEPECIKQVNKKGELLEMNPAGLAMIEADNLQQVLGLNVLNLIEPEYKKAFNDLNKNVFNGKSSKLIFRLKGLKGSYRWLETNAVPFRNNAGDIISHLAITRDITDKKIAEEELQKTKDNLQAIIDNTEIGYVLLSADLDIIYANEKSKQIAQLEHGYTFINGDSYYNYFEKDKVKKLNKILKTVFSGQKYEYEIQFNKEIKKNSRWYFIKYIPSVNSFNKVNGIIVSLADITSQKKNERKLSQSLKQIEITNNKLESIIKEKDKFFSIIAHDLKSPFSGFLGLTNLFSTEITKLTVNELIEYSKSLNYSAENLFKLLENLLEWSMLHRGMKHFSPEILPLNYIINNNLDLIDAKAKIKEIKLINKIEIEFQIFADTQMLNGIIRNLLSNALKFTPRGGSIEIDAIDISNKIRVSIKDNGIGMNKLMLSKLFNIGEKTSRNGTEDESSTGLGLLLCKEYVEKHKGTIWVESTVGIGTTFYFTIPNN